MQQSDGIKVESIGKNRFLQFVNRIWALAPMHPCVLPFLLSANRVFETPDAIVDTACEAWRKLIAQPDAITSIGMREWAHVGQSQ